MMNKTVEAILILLAARMPLNKGKYLRANFLQKKVGVVIIDEVNGFCLPGCGNLAPPESDPMIRSMIDHTVLLAEYAKENNLPVLVLQECHIPGKLEPPYLQHCEEGTGEEELVWQLIWLPETPNVTVMKKSCISGVIGGIRPDGTNKVFDWVNQNELEEIIVVGICTDICDLQFVQPMLSARNFGLMPTLKEVVVFTEGCASYDLPIEVVQRLGIPEHLAHDQAIMHYVGLYLMQMSGAIIVDRIEI